MDFEKYKVSAGGKSHFVQSFKDLMNVEVKSIYPVDDVRKHVQPRGDLPVGYIMFSKGSWYLVGWTDTAKRMSCSNLFPWKKKELVLYDKWQKRTWTNSELYSYIDHRLKQLSSFPEFVRSIRVWELERQALYSCVSMMDKKYMPRLVSREMEMLEHVMCDNGELLKSTCVGLGLDVDIVKLLKHVENLYTCPLKIENADGYRRSGILQSIEEEILKWPIKDDKKSTNGGDGVVD